MALQKCLHKLTNFIQNRDGKNDLEKSDSPQNFDHKF